MIKYAKSDIKDGFTLLKFGIGNILTSLLKGDAESYEVPIHLDYVLVSQIIKYLFPAPEFEYRNGTLYVSIDDDEINVEFEDTKTIFSIV